MFDSDPNEHNINFLLKKLCISVLKEYDVTPDTCNNILGILRSKAYEELLRGLKDSYIVEENFDAERALNVYIFSGKLWAHKRPSALKNLVELEERIETIRKEEYFFQDEYKRVLQFLLALSKDAKEHNKMPIKCSSLSLLVPGPFTLFANFESNRHYPTYDCDMTFQELKYIPELPYLKRKENPYLPKFLFEKESNFLASFKTNFKTSMNWKDPQSCIGERCACPKLMEDSTLYRNVKIANSSTSDINKRCRITKTPTHEEPHATSIAKESRRVFSWNWECLGCFGVQCSNPFVGEAKVTMLLKCHLQKVEQQIFEAKIMQQSQILKDLKLLCVGIQSDLFQYDEFLVFSMLPKTTINNVLPDTFKYFVEEFLECGTCFKRMQTMIMKKDYKYMFDGFMFKALCSAIDEYLLTFRQYVFGQQDKHIMAFSGRVKKIMTNLINLSYTLGINPNVSANVKPPMGSQFLGYIYREITRLTEKDYITLLIFILRRCCHVYFKHLQKWIFYGILDDPCNELFIGFVDHYRQSTKYFYDRAYYIRKESVPGFFHNFEHRILQCGKYTILLKAFKPNHPLLNLEYPAMSVCMSHNEIEKLKEQCRRYYDETCKICSPVVTIRQYFEKRAAHKSLLFKQMMEKSVARIARWNDDQHELQLIEAERKRKTLEQLLIQIECDKQKKIDERKARVEMELKFLRENQKLEDQRTLLENINLRKRIEYYQELSDIIRENELNNIDRAKKINECVRNDINVVTGDKKSIETSRSTSSKTEFESVCDGNEKEDISDELVQEFPKNEANVNIQYHLNEKLEQTDEEGNLVNNEKKFTVNKIHLVECDNANIISDILNCNELINNESVNIAQQNRIKALSGSNMRKCLTETVAINENIKLNIENKENSDFYQETRGIIQNTNLKTSENDCSTQHQQLQDINQNVVVDNDTELSELQRNRNRILRNDSFTEYGKISERMSKVNLSLNLNSDRTRIQSKVLENDFNIITGELNNVTSAKLITSEPILLNGIITPMSTTSDGDINFSTNDKITSHEDNVKNDNGRYVIKKKKNQGSEVPTSAESITSIPSTTLICTGHTICSSANLSGETIFGKDIRGSTKTESVDNQEQVIENVESHAVDVNNNNDNVWSTPDYTQPYKRCKELLDSHFKCQSLCPYIRLHKIDKYKRGTLIESNDALNQNDMGVNVKSLSVITLTEFLQKSVTIPMEIHLDLLNNEVMRMFLEDLNIFDHFRSLRNYYFLMDGEFGSIISDGIIEKLESGATPEALFNYQTLHSILDAAINSSITGKNKNADNLSFLINDVPEKFHLRSPKVLNNLTLNYSIHWPLNLILTPEVLKQYGDIFKYLIRVRRISWILERAYRMLQDVVKRNGSGVLASPQYRHVQLIRHKFYHFVHALQNHITANALQASWKNFKDELLNAQSIDDIYKEHNIYIKRIMFLCMLNRRSSEFHIAIENIFRISLRFYENFKSRQFKVMNGQTYYTHAYYDKLVQDEIDLDEFIKYAVYLGNKIVKNGYQAEIGEFVNLINFNHYYI